MAFCHSDGLCQHYKWASEQTPLKREDISIMEGEREICVKHLTQHNIAYNENLLERATHCHASVSDLQLSKEPFLGNANESDGHLWRQWIVWKSMASIK